MNEMKSIVKPESLTELAYEEIRKSIVHGVLKPGEVYQETYLADILGISKTPVREALLKLSVDGFVTYIPRKGVKINLFSNKDVIEILDLRKAIELAIVEKVCQLSNKLDFNIQEMAIVDQKKAMATGDMETFLNADRQFHLSLAEKASNKRMLSVLETLRDFVRIIGLEALTLGGRTESVIAEHQEILTAIKASNQNEAIHAMRKHIDRTFQAVMSYRAKQDDSDWGTLERSENVQRDQ